MIEILEIISRTTNLIYKFDYELKAAELLNNDIVERQNAQLNSSGIEKLLG